LTKNTQRQDHSSVPSPPTTGPPAAAKAAMVAHHPIARRRMPGSSYSARTNANDEGTNIADAAPCAARAAIRAPMFQAKPQATEAAVNRPTPQQNTVRAEHRSDSAPPVRMPAASTTR
jgi:hypothetical protein